KPLPFLARFPLPNFPFPRRFPLTEFPLPNFPFPRRFPLTEFPLPNFPFPRRFPLTEFPLPFFRLVFLPVEVNRLLFLGWLPRVVRDDRPRFLPPVEFLASTAFTRVNPSTRAITLIKNCFIEGSFLPCCCRESWGLTRFIPIPEPWAHLLMQKA